MAFDDLVRSGVALADNLTGSLQPSVTHEAWIGNDGFGGYNYAAGVSRAALIEHKNDLVRDPDGREIVAKHTITFLRPIPDNGAAGRKEPIDPRDKITLPDGTTGPILDVNTFVDPDTGAGYYQIVKLG